MHRYYYIDQAVSEQDCDTLVDKYKELDFQKALIKVKKETNPELYRKAKIYWLEKNDAVVRSIWSYVLEINQIYKLHLNGYQKAQLTRYDKKDDFYCWHQDSVYNEEELNWRKLSAVLQLSKPEDYKGCELQLFNGDRDLEELPIKKQGSLIIFRSEEWHRVTSLTKGVRYSLVFWAIGSPLV